MASDDELVRLFKQVGFSDKTSQELAKNKKVSGSLYDILKEDVGSEEPINEKKLGLFQTLAVQYKGKDVSGNAIKLRPRLTQGILKDELKTNLQIEEGFKYINNESLEFTEQDFKTSSGVGIELTKDDVSKVINKYIEDHKSDVETQRYTIIPKLLGATKKLPELKWAPASTFKPIIDEAVEKICGPKDERDVIKKEKKKLVKKAVLKEEATERTMFSEGFLGELHKPGENPQAFPELMAKHLEFTKGQVFTRFPPEPNGFLHIGHSKAIMVNFGYAQFHKGKCYLRYDDTNPEAEEEVYFNSIKDMVDWLGFEPWKITYSSDYFDELYQLAEDLIKRGKAYVCHSTPEEVKLQRGLKADGTLGGKRFPSPWRDRSVEDNLKEFRRMRDGEYEVGKAVLRMKQDIESSSPQMWDLVAYRVLNAPHHRTGDKWKIYPTYDFTHCLVDSIENISHSLCTTEFILLRESYEWLCDQLHVYRPAQREYGRLNITGTILSKRKIAKLVDLKIVRGWDDPRLYTLEAIKRRGVPPGAILSFINTLGVTTSTTNIQEIRFESAIRNYLDQTTPRLMMLLNPILLELENVDETFAERVTMPFKNDATIGERELVLTKRFYIDGDDYRDEADKDYRRLAPGQPVGLINIPFNVSVKQVVKNADGKIEKIIAHYDNEQKAKPKTYIQWISADNKLPIKQVRIQNRLFKSENPQNNPQGFLNDINENSEEIFFNSIIEKQGFKEIETKSPLNIEIKGSQFNIKEKKAVNTIRFQALRIGYFCVDKDTDDQDLILNRIVSLKEDSAKK